MSLFRKWFTRNELDDSVLQELVKYSIVRVGGVDVRKCDVDKLYESYLLRAGHCPVCDDYLYVAIELVDYSFYRVVRRCVSHKCSFSEDISREFNERLGIPFSRLEYQNTVYPKCTGVLKSSFEGGSHYWSLVMGRDGVGRKGSDVDDCVLGYRLGVLEEKMVVQKSNQVKRSYVLGMFLLVVSVLFSYWFVFVGL